MQDATEGTHEKQKRRLGLEIYKKVLAFSQLSIQYWQIGYKIFVYSQILKAYRTNMGMC